MEEVTFELNVTDGSYLTHIWQKYVPGERKSMCKSPGPGVRLMLHELRGGGWNSVSQRKVWSKRGAETRSHPRSADLSAKFGFHSNCNWKPLKDLRQIVVWIYT